MARLKEPPRTRLTQDREQTPPPPSPPRADASIDGDAATQQLLDETRASASKPSRPHPPPQSAAVLGANLLNAARIDFRHSSPIRMSRKPGSGRLNRVSSSTEPRRVHLARPRGNIWEVPESPEKSPFRPQGTVKRVSLKQTKKKSAEARSEDHELPSDLPPPQRGEDSDEPGLYKNIELGDHQSPRVHEAPMPSSPPRAVPASNDTDERNVQIEDFTSRGSTRCAEVSYRQDKPAGPRYEQCHNVAKNSNDHGPRCTHHLRKLGSLRCEYMVDQDGHEMQCRTPGINGTNKCTVHAKLENIMRKPIQKRKFAEDQDVEIRRSKSPRLQKHGKAASKGQVNGGSSTGARQQTRESVSESHPEVRIHARKNKTTKQRQAGSKTSVSNIPAQDYVAESIEAAASASPTRKRRMGSQPQSSNMSTSHLRHGRLPKRSKPAEASKPSEELQPEVDRPPDDAQGEDSSEAEMLEVEAFAQDVYTPKPLRRIFEFLDLEKRPGNCQTELCRDIKSSCDKTGSLFRKQNLSPKEVNQKTEAVQAMLRTVRAVQKGDHGEVKADMYGYVFRSLAKLLVSLFKYFAAQDCDFTKSLRPLRILSPFVHHIIALKDLLASWKVSVPQRYSGDRLIADVNSLLIAPLRNLEALLDIRLSQLEQSERDIERLADLEQQIEEEGMDAARKHEAVQARTKRYDRWQQLHIVRMSCEPDPRRRGYLTIIKLEDLEEKDANGVIFERVPVFKDRNSTPSRWPSSTATARPWSDEQIEALIDSLEAFAGPDIFQNVFMSCCRPGGPLRDFNVTDITTKAAWIRSSFTKLHQERGWEMPEWVRQIPVLP